MPQVLDSTAFSDVLQTFPLPSEIPDFVDTSTELSIPFTPVSREIAEAAPKPVLSLGWYGELRSIAKDYLSSGSRRRPKTLTHIEHELGEPFLTQPANEAAKQFREEKLALVNGSYSAKHIANGFHLYEYDVPVKDMPLELDGVSILHLSDIHFKVHNRERMWNVQNLARYLKANDIAPDITAITGDIITDEKVDLDARALRILDRVNPSSDLRFVVLGNHDYYGGAGKYVTEALESIGYQNLNNAQQAIRINGETLRLWGVDDLLEASPEVPYDAALYEGDVNILLTHNPDTLNGQYPDVFDLALAGHLHGGEIIGGQKVMELTNYSAGLNKQVLGWKPLTERCLSYIHPGGCRHWLPRALLPLGAAYPGATIMRLRSMTEVKIRDRPQFKLGSVPN